MSQSKCCSCNGSNARCIGCRCARNKVPCISCYPGRHRRCKNVATALRTTACPPPNVTLPDFAAVSSPPETQNVTATDEDDFIQDIVIKLRKCRSSLVRHIPKGSRHLFAKVLTNTIETALNRNDTESWIRLLIMPTLCLRSPPHNGKKHTTSLCSFIKKQISFFETTNDLSVLLQSIAPTKPTPLVRKQLQSDARLRKSVSDKLSEGDVHGAVRLLASEDSLAPYSSQVLSDLLLKHPSRPSDRRPLPSAADSPAIIVTEAEVSKTIKSFPAGSSGGITRLRPQHLKEALRPDAGSYRDLLLTQLTALVNRIVCNQIPECIRPVLLGANITALNKKNGGIRPIAVGETLRRIACKCVMRQVEPTLVSILTPHQLGCGVRAGVDAAVHSTRDTFSSASDSQIFLKLDIRNAFNTMRRDHIAECLRKYAPSLLITFVSCYSEPSYLAFGEHILLSDEGLQQGDPLSPAYFCLGLHDVLSGLSSPSKTAYLDDISLFGDVTTVLQDLKHLIPNCREIGLELNSTKCELTLFGEQPESPTQQIHELLPDLKIVPASEVTLLGAAMGENSLDALLNSFLSSFKILQERLLKLSSHDALFLLRNSLSVPKLLHTLRTTPCFTRLNLLRDIDSMLLHALSSIINVKLSATQALQASLPVKLGGLGILSAEAIAPSAFLSSLHAADPTCQLISQEWQLTDNAMYDAALSQWKSQCSTSTVPSECLNRQKSWSHPIHLQQADSLLSTADDHNRARLSACRVQGSGDWLHALPSTSLGLHLNNEQLRIAVSVRLGAPVSIDHTCVRCGSLADGYGRHAFCCPKSTGRHLRHHLMNDVIDRAMHSIQMPTRLEPAGLCRDNNLKPDGITLTPWTRGKSLAWDVTCAYPLASSWLSLALRGGSAVASAVEDRKIKKYEPLTPDFHVQPISLDIFGGKGESTAQFIAQVGASIKNKTDDKNAATFFKQRLAIAVQIGNSACVLETLPELGNTLLL